MTWACESASPDFANRAVTASVAHCGCGYLHLCTESFEALFIYFGLKFVSTCEVLDTVAANGFDGVAVYLVGDGAHFAKTLFATHAVARILIVFEFYHIGWLPFFEALRCRFGRLFFENVAETGEHNGWV